MRQGIDGGSQMNLSRGTFDQKGWPVTAARIDSSGVCPRSNTEAPCAWESKATPSRTGSLGRFEREGSSVAHSLRSDERLHGCRYRSGRDRWALQEDLPLLRVVLI